MRGSKMFRHKTREIFFLLVVLIFILGIDLGKGNAREARQRLIEMTYTVEIEDIPEEAREVRVWIPYPVSDESQRIMDMVIKSPYPTSLHYDSEWGNAILHLRASGPGISPFKVQLTFMVLRKEDLHDNLDTTQEKEFKGNMGPFQRYLQSTKFAIIDETVKNLATKVTRGKKDCLAKARAIYDFILDHVDYNKEIPGWGQGDTKRLCLFINEGKAGKGNCTDFHSLFSSLMRACGIPVVFEMGYPLKPGRDEPEGKAGGYHCWAKFYLPGQGWIPVDISEADKHPDKSQYFFGSICENRVRFSRGRDILLEPHQQAERLNFFGPDPYIEVDGKPFKGFRRTISYQNLD
jgi:transglutaminase-like putative cysteine protease